MPHTVSLSDATFAKLQLIATPFIDTPESVVASLVDDELKRRGTGAVTSRDAGGAARLDPDRHESLTHARLISASVDGHSLHRPKWNSLLDHIHVLGMKKLGSFAALKRASNARLKEGKYEEEGFHFLPDANISIQGVDANSAWDHSLGLARQLPVAIEAKLEWRDRDEAARPGQSAILSWEPSKLAIA